MGAGIKGDRHLDIAGKEKERIKVDLNWRKCDSVVLRGDLDECDIVVRAGLFHPKVGDQITLLNGYVEIDTYEIEGIEIIDERLKIYMSVVSEMSSCCPHCESPVIEKFVKDLEDLLAHGGYCGGKLNRWIDLKRRIVKVFSRSLVKSEVKEN